jgi:cell division septation protein DedD
MPYRRKNSAATDRVLESRHVIGLFALLLLFSGIFFALGFVMGRNQYDGNVLAAHPIKGGVPDPFSAPKPLPGKHNNSNGVSAAPVATAPATPPPAETNPGWDIHEPDSAAKNFPAHDAQPSVSVTPQKTPSAAGVKNTNATVPVSSRAKQPNAPLIPTGSYTLQVAALKSQSDALDLATRLQKKKFPSFVLSPQGDPFYRVQVGPYSDQKSADAAKKGLDAAGFKAIVKH